MTRLELLKKEREIVKSLRCMEIDAKDTAIQRYDHEITAIEEHGAPNREAW